METRCSTKTTNSIITSDWPCDESARDLGPRLFVVLDHREPTVPGPQQHLGQLGHVLLAVDSLRCSDTHHVARPEQLHLDPAMPASTQQRRRSYACRKHLYDVYKRIILNESVPIQLAQRWGPIYKIVSYDLSYDYRKFIVRSTYDSDLKRAEIFLRNIVI